MSIRVSLRCMLRLIRVDTLLRVHNVGFLAGRLLCILTVSHRGLQASLESQMNYYGKDTNIRVRDFIVIANQLENVYECRCRLAIWYMLQ